MEFKERTETKYLSRMIKNNQISPRTGNAKKGELEKWVTKEREEITKTKKAFEEQWRKTEDIIKQTQENAQFMKKLIANSSAGEFSSRSGFNSSRKMQIPPLNIGQDFGRSFPDSRQNQRSNKRSDNMISS